MHLRYLIILILTVGLVSAAKGPQSQEVKLPEDTPFYDREYAWVDSVLGKMTLDQKIGQLFMVPAYSNKDAAHVQQIEQLIENYQVGGLIFMQGGPVRQAKLTNNYQKLSKTPLLIGMDAEWGPAMRLDSVIAFQRQLTWGAMTNDSIVYQTGVVIAKQLQRLGVHVSFSPDVDVNNNPNNPVIGDRSFGEDKFNVALKGLMYMQALQDNSIIACAKHFPGHGDVDADSHKTLPVINHSYAHLDSLELYPFKVLMNEGVGSIMLAHLFVPALDDTEKTPTSLSPKVGVNLVRETLQYRGLIFSDALNMKGAAENFAAGELEVRAFIAGNDMLLFSENVPVAFEAIKKAVADGRISTQRIDESVRRVLKAKAFAGLDKKKLVEVKNITADLNSTEATLLKRSITEHSITLAHADGALLPFKQLDTLTIAALSIGNGNATAFENYLGKYARVDQYQIKKEADAAAFTAMLQKLKGYDAVIIGVHDMKRARSSNYGINTTTEGLIEKLQGQTKTIVCLFGTPYALERVRNADYHVVSYDDDEYTQQATAMALFGALKFEGKLPVSAGTFKVNSGIETGAINRLKYTIPEEVGIAADKLKRIDSIAQACIAVQAAPGCQVLVAKEGKVIYDKAFGTYTYSKKQSVELSSIYDLASVTKTSATTMMLMDLYDAGKLNLRNKVSDYLPETEGTNVGGLVLQDILTHQSGLPAWVPFYKRTLNPDGTLNPLYYNQSEIPGFTTQVADGVYMRDDYRDSIWSIIQHVEIKSKKYVYSDLSMYISRRIAEKIAGISLDTYVYQKFYRPLGMQTTWFNPLEQFPKERIVPTENDNYFRFQTVQGYVHDMGAAMMGGVEGHAGLFSNAEDLAILYQMLLNNGNYGGVQYLDEKTVALFTKKQSDISRRGLGFDKPEANGPSPCSGYASPQTFGHQGFTGICVWADPEYDLLYIFLSNRVQPTAEPNKLSSEGIRNKIMDVIYEAVLTSNPPHGPASD